MPPRRAALALLLSCLSACSSGSAEPSGRLAWPDRPRATASSEFWRTWGDGKAELDGYRATVTRYGTPRAAEIVLVYVTEPHDRRTWVKDDSVRAPNRVEMLKLNASVKFQTGIYPYSLLTSVFAPVDRYGPIAFAPTKITFSAQEWCGHVYVSLLPSPDRFVVDTRSYFAGEDTHATSIAAPMGTLYEDALLVALRELDGPFADGHDFHGPMVPSVWRSRRDHHPLAPEDTTIERTIEGDVTHFVLRAGRYERRFAVERTGAHRVLSWRTNDGDEAHLVGTTRLPYWSLHDPGDERYRETLGLPPPAPAP